MTDTIAAILDGTEKPMTDEDRQMYEELCGYENLIELIRIELTTGQLVSRAYRALQLIEERSDGLEE